MRKRYSKQFGMLGTTAMAALLVLAYTAPIVNAQNPPSLVNMEVTAKPAIPKPFDQVELTVKSYNVSLATALITWKVDGQVVRSSRGAQSHTITAGPIGSATAVEIVAENEGRTVTTSYILRPQYVGIAWEAQTYTPILYRGKALHAPSSSIRVTALPVLVNRSGIELSEDDLQYTWSIHRSVQPQLSGYGKQSVVVENSRILQPLDIAVEVRSRDNTLVAANNVRIPVSQPQILLYEQNPVLGVRYARALGNEYAISAREATLVAEPYHLSTPVRDDASLVFDWRVGAQRIEARGLITLRPEGVGAGRVPLSLVMQSRNEPLQSARTTVQVLFKADDSAATNFLSL